MGQAKRRGTFEQRQREALARRAGIIVDGKGEQVASVVPRRSFRRGPSRLHTAMLAMMAAASLPNR
jgi:hypothetical protein